MTRLQFSVFAGFLLCFSPAIDDAAARPVSPRNILVTEDNILYEFTLGGREVQSWPIPHPRTDRYDATDVVVDSTGKVHVVNTAPFDLDYISTLNPSSGRWTHTSNPDALLGNVSDGDFSAFNDIAVTKSVRMNLITKQVTALNIPGTTGVGEVSFGSDGLLYALDSSSPRPGVRVVHPATLALIREFDLRDGSGTRLDARGIVVAPDGKLYAADWDGRIYQFQSNGTFIRSVPTGVSNLLDIDLRPDGVIVVGGRFGEIAVTNLALTNVRTFKAGNGLAYVGFDSTPGRPDNWIGTRIGRQNGKDTYSLSGNTQSIAMTVKRAPRSFFFTAENDGFVNDNLMLRVNNITKKIQIDYFQLTGGTRNVSAELKTTGLNLALGPEGRVTFKAKVRQKTRKGVRRNVNFTSTSTVASTKKDRVKAQILPPKKKRN